MSIGTVSQHLAQAIQTAVLDAVPSDFYSEQEEHLMRQAAAEHGADRLGPLHEALGGQITYSKLWFFRAFAQRQQAVPT
jgi:hypothetical protein